MSCLRFPWLSPIRNPCELRGLCRRSDFGPRTCGRSINQFFVEVLPFQGFARRSGIQVFRLYSRPSPVTDRNTCGESANSSLVNCSMRIQDLYVDARWTGSHGLLKNLPTYARTHTHAHAHSERECCLLVLNLVSSTLSCIRQPRPRLFNDWTLGFGVGISQNRSHPQTWA